MCLVENTRVYWRCNYMDKKVLCILLHSLTLLLLVNMARDDECTYFSLCVSMW